MAKPLAGSITNTVHRPHAATVILIGITITAWTSKWLEVASGTSIGVLANVPETARQVKVVLVEDWFLALGSLRIPAHLHAALRTCPMRALQNVSIITNRLFNTTRSISTRKKLHSKIYLSI